MRIPSKLSANTNQAVLINQIIDCLAESRIVNSPDHVIEHTPFGVAIRGRSASKNNAVGATRYRVKRVYGTYLVCRSWDGTAEGDVDELVAKPPHLRWYASAWPGMTVVGAALTFVWSSLTDNIDGQRTVSDGTNPDQTEIVVPVWQVAANGAGLSGGYDEIWADTPVGGTGVTVSGTVVTLMDDNRNGRRWCLLNTQPT